MISIFLNPSLLFFSEAALQDLFYKLFYTLKKAFSFPIFEWILNKFKQHFIQLQ